MPLLLRYGGLNTNAPHRLVELMLGCQGAVLGLVALLEEVVTGVGVRVPGTQARPGACHI